MADVHKIEERKKNVEKLRKMLSASSGFSIADIAKKFDVQPNTVRQWLGDLKKVGAKLHVQEGEKPPGTRGRRPNLYSLPAA